MVYVVKEKTNEINYTITRKDGTEEIVYKEKFIGVVNEQPKRLTLPLNTIVGKCPKCGQPLVIKKGKYGEFVSCSGFKVSGCKNTYSLEHFKVFDKKLLNKLNVYDAVKNDRESRVFGIRMDKEYYNNLDLDLQKEIKGYMNQYHDFQEPHYCRIKVTL